MENLEVLEFDYIIIGAGAAGLASAQYAARGGLKTVVLEGIVEGGQIMQITELENYPGIFPSCSGVDFIKTMKEQTLAFGAQIHNVNVSSIDKTSNQFVIKTKDKI